MALDPEGNPDLTLDEIVKKEVELELAKQLPEAIRKFLNENLELVLKSPVCGEGGSIDLDLKDPENKYPYSLGSIDSYDINQVIDRR